MGIDRWANAQARVFLERTRRATSIPDGYVAHLICLLGLALHCTPTMTEKVSVLSVPGEAKLLTQRSFVRCSRRSVSVILIRRSGTSYEPVIIERNGFIVFALFPLYCQVVSFDRSVQGVDYLPGKEQYEPITE